MSRLFSTKAAEKWEEAYPLGNGRLGAMVFAQPGYEKIQLNEDSVWYGRPINRINSDAPKYLPEIRTLIRNGKIPEAEKLMEKALSGIPQSQRPYQSAGDLWINWEDTVCAKEGYERELDLKHAVVNSICKGEKGEVKKQYFTSHPDQVMVIHASSSEDSLLSCTSLLTRSKYYETVEKINDDTILMRASCGEGGVNLAVAVKAISEGGNVYVIGEHLCVRDAKNVTFYVAMETTFYCGEEGSLPDYSPEDGEDPVHAISKVLKQQLEADIHVKRALKRVNAAAEKGYEKVWEDHLTDYCPLFDRVKFSLGGKETEKLDYTKTYFDYGRYLLIASSRPGTLPANLQGIWNDKMEPTWDSKFTININTEMNYWPAEVCDLSECHLPLFDLLKRMQKRGREVAQKMYGCRGFVAHHNTDIWADCAPQDIWVSSAYWVMGAAWLCTHVWKHYEYTGDQTFLKEMYPVVKEASIFFHDFLIESNGELVTSPSISPENTYILPDGTKGCACEGPSMDTQILRDLLTIYDKSSEILGIEDEDTKHNKEVMARLPKEKIGKHGQIMEWREDYEEDEPGHRHISHVYAFHPSNQITVDGTPELAEAVRKTLDRRLTYGGGHTGWSCAWIINLFARLGDGEAAWDNMKKLFEKSTFPNMMDNHPLFDYFVFQIDGNFGATAAITEMILQSNSERNLLLPAIPKDWEEGSMEGLVMYGGAKADISWKDGELTSCKIYASRPFETRVCYKDQIFEVNLKENEEYVLIMGDGEVSYELFAR